MPYCLRCGVETDPSERNCPLCSTAIPVFPELGEGEPSWPARGVPGDPAKRYYTPRQIRASAIWVASSGFAATAAAVTGLDLFVSGNMTWGVYALASLAAAWGVTVSVFAWRSPFVLVPVWWGLVAALLAVFDLADATLNWVPTLGLPLAALPFVLVIGAYLLARRRRGYFVLAVITAAIGVGLTAVEVLVTAWLGQPGLRWSLLTSVVLLPLSLVFFFLHFGLKLSLDLRRTFHI